MSENPEHRIALFIDFENLVTNTGITASSFDLQPSLDRLLEKGKVIFRRAYCDWSRFKDAKSHLHEFGVELVDVPPSTSAGKNGADMRLVIDALELCYAREYIDTFVIGSGDSDFCPLAYKLRENDRRVIGLGVRESTSRLFIKACDEFIYLKAKDEVRKPERRPSKEKDDKKAEKGDKGEKKPRRGGGGGEAKPAAEVPDVAREVVTSLLGRATGPINPSFIKETIVRKQPDFDERDHGFSTFSKLLQALETEGLLKRQQMGRQWYVLPAEGNPPEAPAEAHEPGQPPHDPEEPKEGEGEGGPDQEELPF
ncbi:MAG TPA: NYN domain-containing protein [Myxococcales bacterium]